VLSAQCSVLSALFTLIFHLFFHLPVSTFQQLTSSVSAQTISTLASRRFGMAH